MAQEKYYRGMLPISKRITTVFKFYEGKKEPEKYVKGKGWVADSALLCRLMNGELSDADEISSDEATKIIEALERG